MAQAAADLLGPDPALLARLRPSGVRLTTNYELVRTRGI